VVVSWCFLLIHVLSLLSNSQSLNFIVGIFLLFMDEVDAFWMLCHVVEVSSNRRYARRTCLIHAVLSCRCSANCVRVRERDGLLQGLEGELVLLPAGPRRHPHRSESVQRSDFLLLL
jgi:hypothetical protein